MEYLDYLDKVRSSKKPNEFNRCENVLDEKTMYLVGISYQRFILGEISYKELGESIAKLGFTLDVILENPTKFNKEALNEFNKRKENMSFIKKDVKGLLLSNLEYKNIIVYYDKPILRVLAKYSDVTADEELKRIFCFEGKTYFRKVERN